MTTVRRLLTTLALSLTIVVGAGIPASAGFGDTAGLPTISIAAGTVTAPTRVEAKLLCTTAGNGNTSHELKIEWQRSASRGVTGYEITVHPASGAPYRLAVTGPTDEAYFTADQALIDSKPSFTVTTLTSYAWSATSTRQGITPC